MKIREVVYNFNTNNRKCATSSEILVNGEQIDCLLDSGAYTSFISEMYCNSRNFKHEAIVNQKKWVTANGSPIVVKGQVTLNLKIGNENLRSI